MIEIKTFAKPKKTGGSSGSSSSTKYISGVISEAEHAARADKAKRAEVADQANYAGTAASAQNAAYASEAGSLREDAEILQQYLSLKDTVDPQVVNGMVIFAKGLISNLLAQLKGGASFGSDGLYSFDKDGNLVIESAHSRDFDEMLQNGFALKRNPTSGKYTLSISDLIVWGRMVINTLETRKKYAIGGNVYLSGASSKIQHVEKVYSEDGETVVGYKCYILKDDGTMATQNNWVVGDQALCQTFDIEEGVYQNISNQYYWRLVTQVSEENVAITEKYTDKDGNEQIRELYEGQKFAWVVLSKDDCDTNSGIPASGDTIVLDGHRLTENEDTDYTERTNVLMLEATGSGSPRIIALTGVVDYKHTTDNEVFILSPRKVIFTTEHFEIRTASGAPITFVHFMGPWVKGTEYHYYDQVSHANALWTCIVEKGKSTTDEPTDGSTYWRKEMSGGKGEKGDDAVSYSVSLMKSLRTIAGHSDQSAVTVSFRKQEGSKSVVSGKINDFGESASVKCYIDGAYSTNMTDWINSGNDYFGYLNYENAWAGKSVITVVMYIGSNIVASSNFSLGQSGEGVVMAYKNATSQPSKPTVEDLSQLSGGWSRTPQKGGSYNKVSNVSYGNYSVDNTTSGYSTSEYSEVSDSGEVWRKSPSGLSDRFGWAIMKVSFSTNVDNADVKVVIKAYSEANFDFIQVHELDTEITGSNDLRKKGVAYISGNGIETSYSYHVATAGQHFFYVSYCKDSSGNANGDYGLFRFDLSDNIVTLPSTVWMSQATLKDGKAVLPWSEPVKITGKDGTDGEDAYRVEVSPATLVFDTGDNGLVASATLSGKYATVTVYKGNQKISANNLSLPSNYETKKSTNVDGNISNVDGEARVTISGIGTETISKDVKVSKSSGQISFPIDVFGERNTLMWATVNVQVNVAKFTGSVVVNNKQYESKFEEISTRFKDTPTNKDLTDAESRITQTAREISLSVSEKTIGRRNLLVGSAFQRDDSNRIINYSASIEINSGYQGTNCVKSIDDTKKGDPHYIGVFWDGSQGGKSIKITKGKKYVLSCYCKTNDINAIFCLEALYTDKQTNAQRKGGPKYLTNSFYRCESANRWELFTAVIDTTDAEYDYIAFNFFEYSNGDYGCIEAWICRPMVEEGDTYNGWTLSTEDYDYIGGNMLDNTLSLDKSGTLYDVNGELTPLGFGESTSIYKSFTYKLKGTVYSFSQLPSYGNTYGDTYYVSNTETCYRYNGSEFENVGNDYYYNILHWGKLESGAFVPFGLEANKDYVFSFMAKGTGKLSAYFYNPDTNVFVESSLGVTENNVNGQANFQLTSDWKKYWVHWRPSDSLHKFVLLRLNRTIQSSAGDAPIADCYIAQPKLEAGAVVTEYTERKSDLVDKASLKAAGIEVTANKVKLYGNQIEVKPTKEGNAVYALFGDDGFINTNILNVQHVYAKNASGTVYGHFGYLGATGGTDSDGYQYPLWVGASTCGSAPFSVRSDGYIYATKGKIGPLNMDEKGLFYYPLDINTKLRKATDLRLGGLWVSQDSNDCNSELMVGNRCWAFDPLNESKQLQFTSTTLFSYPVIRPSVMIAKRWTNLGNGDSRTDPASPALMVESEGVGITSNGLNYLGGIAMGCTRTSVIANDTLTAMNLNRISFVVMTNDSEYTFPMPKTPVIGQILIVVQGNAKINFDPQGKTVYHGGKINTTSNKFYSSAVGQFNIFIYDGYYWQLQWINQK